MIGTKAWHLRQDGKAFPVKVHMYCMEDDDLSSEAECASFIISSQSSDIDVASYTLDAWMALLIEEKVSYDVDEEGIEECILDALHSLPYKFPYPLSDNEYLDIHRRSKNFNDVDTLYEFIDEVRENLSTIQENIKHSINQQFCRVRYGGQYNSITGNAELWFRVSSTDYNWADTIYEFAILYDQSHKLDTISVCRDTESDEGFDNTEKERFYRAKDGTYYRHMPVQEFFTEEHEHSIYFESVNVNEGVIATIRNLLRRGCTYNESIQYLKENYDIQYNKNIHKYLVKKELAMLDKINII